MGTTAVFVLVIAILGLSGLAFMVPILCFSLGVGGLRNENVEDPRLVEPGGDDPDYERRYRQFLALGFRPVGFTRASGWFAFPTKWRWRSLQGQRWMATPDGKTFALFHRLIAAEPVRITVMTLNDGDGFVSTVCPGMGVTLDRGSNHGRFELRGVEPEELVAKHRENVEYFCAQRGLKPIAATFAEASAADFALDLAKMKKMGHGTTRGRIGVVVMLLGFVAPFVYARMHRHHDLAPTVPPPPVAHTAHHLSKAHLLLLALYPLVTIVLLAVWIPWRRKRLILRSHKEDISDKLSRGEQL
jgi:hypothetical protein